MSGRVAIVSGGSSGIGQAAVARLLAEGWRVAYFSQSAASVEASHRAFTARHAAADVMAAVADLRTPEAVRGFIASVVESWGRVDALVCNAGHSPKRPTGRVPLAEIDLAEWRDVLDINLTGALVCCQAVLPCMVARRSGRIVLIGSVAGRTLPRIASASYVASKSALAGLMRSIVSEYSASGISANLICPGRIITEMTGDASLPANLAALARIPIGRLGTPDDIARAITFLVTPEADFINGAVIDINGGEFAAP